MKPLQYIPWFNVQLSHAYFNGMAARCFNVEPNQATEHFKKQQRATFKVSGNSIDALVNSDFPEVASAEDTDAPGLVFEVRVTEPDFVNYTALPDHNPATIAYFNNASSGQLKGGDTDGYHPVAQDWVRILGLSFSMKLEGAKAVSIARANGQSIPDEVMKLQGGVLRTNLNAFGAGGYVLTIDGVEEVIYVNDFGLEIPPLAAIEIFPEFIENGATSYAIAFESRPVKWSYNIFARNVNFEDFDLSIESEGQPFTGPQDASVMQQAAKQFLSENDIPLAIRSVHTPQLIAAPKNSHSGLRKIEMNLPLPSPNSLRAAAGETPAIISEMYVYV